MLFIYVFNNDDCEKLIDAGFRFIKCDNCESTFILRNDPSLNYNFGDMKYVLSDVLSF